MLEIYYTNCCAVQEIGYLQGCKSPEEAVRQFCDSLNNNGDDRWDYRYDREKERTKLGKPSGFYIFTEVFKTYYKDSNRGKDIKTGYGTALAKYIKTNKLGSVTASPMRRNRLNHPEHGVKVFVWAPCEKGLNAWAKKNGVLD